MLDATVEMIGSMNLEVCQPFTGLRPSLVIAPGESDLIAYRGSKLPYSTQMRLMTTFKDKDYVDDLRERVR